MDYLDFDIELREHDGSHYAIAVRSQVGEARVTVPFPFTAAALESDLLKVENAILRSGGGRRKNPTLEEAGVQGFGQKLFEFLLSSELLSLYRQCQQLAAAVGSSVLRGGSFGYNQYFVRCACRHDLDPDSRIDGVGFRILSPGS